MTTLYDTAGHPVSVYDTTGRRVWGPPVAEEIDPLPMLDSYMRFTQVWDIAADGSRDYTTITAAAAAARDFEAAVIGNTRNLGWTNPYRAHLFRVWPGEYKEANWPAPTHFGILGMGDRPEDVRIWDDRGYAGTGGTNPDGSKSGENILNVAGKTVHVENVWLDHQSDDPEWHSIRVVGPAGDAGRQGVEAHQAIFRDVRMTSARNGMDGKCAYDATTGRYDTTFHRVWFDTPGQGQAINLHAGDGRHLFIGCSITAGYDKIADPTLPNDGFFPDGSVPGAIPVGIHVSGSSETTLDLTWAETRTSVWDVGRYEPYPDVPPRGTMALVTYAGKSGTFRIDTDLPHLEPDVPALLVNDGGWISDPDVYTAKAQLVRTTLPDGEADALAEVHRLSDRERAFYGADPASVRPPDSLDPTGVRATRTIPAGTYWLSYELPDVGVIVDKAVYDLSSDGAVSIGTAYQNMSTGEPETTAARGLYQGGAATATGPDTYKLISRWYYPGHKRAWIRVVLTADATGATTTAVGGQAYFTDPAGSTLRPVPAGGVVPAVTILNRAY